MKKDLYLGGEKIEENVLLPKDFKQFFINFVNYLLGRSERK